MKFFTLAAASILAVAGNAQQARYGFQIDNFTAQHAGAQSNDTLVYFDAKYVDRENPDPSNKPSRCYASRRGPDRTTLENIPGASCEAPYLGFALKKQPDGRFRLDIFQVSAGGSRVFAKDALTVFDSGPDLAPYRVQRLEPKAGRSFFIADRNAS